MPSVISLLVVLRRLTLVYFIMVLVQSKYGYMVLVEPNLDGLHSFRQKLVVRLQNLLLRDSQVLVLYSTLLKQMRIELMIMLVLENFMLLMVLQNLLVQNHQKLHHLSRSLVVLMRSLLLIGILKEQYHLLVMQSRDKQITGQVQVHCGHGLVDKKSEHTIIIHYLMLSLSTETMDQLLHQ